MRSVVVVLALLCFISVQAQVVGKKKGSSPYLFSVNNRPVSSDEFLYIYRKNHQNLNEDYTKEKVEEYLSLFINFKLKVEEARSRGIDTTSNFITEFNTYKEELRRPYLPEGKMLDSLVGLTYSRLKEEVRASHILITVKPDATPEDTSAAYNRIMEIKAKAQGGEDFGELAITYSEDPSAKLNKGDLGYFTALQMVYPFENAAYSGRAGDLVGPIRTRFGYHLLSIADRKPARGEVEVSHIMLRTDAGKDSETVKNLAFDIYDQLKGGVSWDELCSQYSDDINSKNTGGRLRPFGVGAMASVPEFDRVAFALQKPGDISDPFQTAYGWHIVKLEQKIPLPGFEELAPSLKSRVQRDERVQVSKQVLLNRLKKDFAFKEDEAVKANVFLLADSSLTKGRWFPQVNAQEVLFSLRSRKVLTTEFIKYAQREQKPTTQSPDQYIQQLYTAFVEIVLNQAFEDELIKSNTDFNMLLREYYEGIMLFDIMEKEVWNKASEDSVGQRAYFKEVADKYIAGERVQAAIYSTTSEENLNQLVKAIETNDTVRVQEFISSRKVRHETGVFQKSDRAVLSKINWVIGDHITESGGMHYLVRVLEFVAPGPMTFEEARPAVTSDYQSYLEENWVGQLRKKYVVKINEKEKQSVFKQLIR